MKRFRTFALLTTAATYFLIFVGGLVRVSGAGLGCPDWPKCFGRWFPPTSIDQLPAGIDPATFNVTLAWIEYANRLVGMTVGFLILGVAILALKHYRSNPHVLWPSLGAAVLVAVQGWQGSQVVSSELEPFIVTIHMVLALIIVSLLIYATLESYAGPPDSKTAPGKFPKQSKALISGLWLVTIVQIVLGSQVRQALESVADSFPGWSGAEWFARVGAISDIHLIAGLLVVVLTIYTGLILLRSEGGKSLIAKRTIGGMILLVLAQSISGLVLLISGLPALSDLFHLWIASLFVGLLLVLLVIVRKPAVYSDTWAAGLKKTLTIVVISVIILGIAAHLVIRQAEASRHPEQTMIPAGSSLSQRLTGAAERV